MEKSIILLLYPFSSKVLSDKHHNLQGNYKELPVGQIICPFFSPSRCIVSSLQHTLFKVVESMRLRSYLSGNPLVLNSLAMLDFFSLIRPSDFQQKLLLWGNQTFPETQETEIETAGEREINYVYRSQFFKVLSKCSTTGF